MIITCASCLTKYHLDDSRISEKGAKVRCSRCKHVFYVVPPRETKEEVAETFESFARFHEDLMDKRKEADFSPLEGKEKEKEEEKRKEEVSADEEEEEKFLFSEQPLEERTGPLPLRDVGEEQETEVKGAGPKKAAADEIMRRQKRGKSSRLFALIIVILALVFGLFYAWTEMGAGGRLASFLKNPIQKATRLWDHVWGTEKEGLIVKDLAGYEEKAEEFSLYVIEGKVDNRSQKTRKHVQVKVEIFDQNRMKVAEKVTYCGRVIDREELKNLPSDFFSGKMMIQPKTEQEMAVPPGKAAPFIIVFKDLPVQAKEFRVEIVEAPSL